MSDGGEKSCPLCAEEMDLTDQQLKPCKCGYEICVWCWHHIMDMAEKDETEGRCPACRNPYNKEKIVGTTAKCDRRLISELSGEKKLKSHRGKSKTSEGRKQLGSVRVIQRTLVYVVGLPLNFADENLLQRREYFGQYGNVLKVSISRTASGAIQHFSNSTCSVYITYSKEEEAVRCIQLVHGFVLDGRPLRACFGTTKYCHAWLRNVPCGNPDCLYLHEIGSQEDSFTKDEIISAYTRSRVQQITGSTNSMQRRSGNVLPPPTNDYCNNSSTSSGKPITKTAMNTNESSTISGGVSPPNSSSGRSAVLPAGASWGTGSSSNQLFPTNAACPNGLSNQKPDMSNSPVAFLKAVAGSNQVSSLQSDTEKKKVLNEVISLDKSNVDTSEPVKQETNTDGRITVSDSSVASVHLAKSPLVRQPHSPPTTKSLSDTSNTVDISVASCGPASDKDSIDDMDGNMEDVCSNILSMSIHKNQQLQNGCIEHFREPVICQIPGKTTNATEEVRIASVQSEFRLEMPTQVKQVDLHEIENDLLSFDNQRVTDPEIDTNRIPDYPHLFNLPKHSNILSPEFINADGLVSINLDKQDVDRNSNLMVSTSNFHRGNPQIMLNSQEVNGAENFNLFTSEEKGSLGRYEGGVGSGAVHMGESSIISNILSLEFDSSDESSLTSPQNLAKLLGETDKRQVYSGVPVSRKIQNSSQSRFSFAREEEHMNHLSDSGHSIGYYEQAFIQPLSGHDFSSSNSLHLEKSISRNGLSLSSGTKPDTSASSHYHISSNKISVSRSQISAPPGFSVPSRAPPPGFTSQTEQILELPSGNHMLDASSLLRNQYLTPSSGNTFSNGDIEFMDPAILAVGRGTLPSAMNSSGLDRRSNFSPQLGTYEEARFQSLLQRSLPSHQDRRYTDMGNSFSTPGDAYGIPSRIMEQTISSNLSPFSHFTLHQSRNGITSNGQWDGWNEAQSGNNLGMSDLLRTEQLGFNKFFGGYEDSKIRMPSSGNLYNRTYGV